MVDHQNLELGVQHLRAWDRVRPALSSTALSTRLSSEYWAPLHLSPGQQGLRPVPDGHEGEAEEEAKGAAKVGHQGRLGVDKYL
jgi:hypothetical protein